MYCKIDAEKINELNELSDDIKHLLIFIHSDSEIQKLIEFNNFRVTLKSIIVYFEFNYYVDFECLKMLKIPFGCKLQIINRYKDVCSNHKTISYYENKNNYYQHEYLICERTSTENECEFWKKWIKLKKLLIEKYSVII